MGIADNTLIIYIWGDNGSSMEGTETGSFNEMTTLNGMPASTAEQQLKLIDAYGGIDAWGGPEQPAALRLRLGVGRQHAVPMGQAGGLALRRHPRPDGRLLAASGSRTRAASATQFTHVHRHRADHPRGRRDSAAEGGERDRADAHARRELRPHLRRRRGEEPPHAAVLRDLRQPGHVQGRLDRLRAAGPDPLEDRSRGRWRGSRPVADWDPDKDKWELYHIDEDFSQANDLAAKHPEKLAELKELFWEDAEKYHVTPLMGGLALLLRVPGPAAAADDVHLLPRHREHRLRHDPAHLQPFVHDRRRPGRSRRAAPRA